MRQLFILSFAATSGCFLFVNNNCFEVGCDAGFSCQAQFLSNESVCVPTCGDGDFNSDVEECDASGGFGAACNDQCQLTIAVGCGDGVEQAGSYCLGAQTFPPILGNVDSFLLNDFDADGDIDIVTISDARVEIAFNNGASIEAPISLFSTGGLFDEIRDFNGDGLSDIALLQEVEEDTQRLTVFIQGADLAFSAGGAIEIPASHSFADLNNDGDLEVIADSSAAAMSVFFGDGLGGFAAPQTLDPSISFLVGGGFTFSDPQELLQDWDGDGDTDLIARRDSTILFLENQFGALIETGIVGALETVSGSLRNQKFSAQDWDNDGDLDLMLGTEGSGFTLFANAAGAFTATTIPLNREGLLNGAVGDFNGDGLPDVLAIFEAQQDTAPIEYALFENNGGGQLIEVFAQEVFATVFVRARDFNGDGRSDAHFLDTTTDTVILQENNSFAAPQFIGTFFSDVYEDMNGDGFLDEVRLIDQRITFRLGAAD